MGCIHAANMADNPLVAKEDDSRGLCPFCRTPSFTFDEEYVKSLKQRVEGDDAMAIYQLGYFYRDGSMGLPQHMAVLLNPIAVVKAWKWTWRKLKITTSLQRWEGM